MLEAGFAACAEDEALDGVPGEDMGGVGAEA